MFNSTSFACYLYKIERISKRLNMFNFKNSKSILLTLPHLHASILPVVIFGFSCSDDEGRVRVVKPVLW